MSVESTQKSADAVVANKLAKRMNKAVDAASGENARGVDVDKFIAETEWQQTNPGYDEEEWILGNLNIKDQKKKKKK